jgi:hypothetical protein
LELRLLDSGFSTFEKPLEVLDALETCGFSPVALVREILRVVGKFLRLDGRVSASLTKDGRESSFLSSMSLRRQ